MKDERVGNVCPKFHIIFIFLVKLSIHSSQEIRALFKESQEWIHLSFPLSSWIFPLYEMASIPLIGQNFILSLF